MCLFYCYYIVMKVVFDFEMLSTNLEQLLYLCELIGCLENFTSSKCSVISFLATHRGVNSLRCELLCEAHSAQSWTVVR